jgi:serine/threonine protein kinase
MDMPSSESVGMQFGPYLLRQRLGVGGMASVWKAIDERGRTLVVKRMLPLLAQDPEFVEMFAREAALSARMRHPNIVRVFDHGHYEGERYLAMEFVHGKDITSTMREVVERGAPSPALGAFVAREVCRALVHVHALTDDTGARLNLIHRDVSLSNVMLGYDGAVKLLDFGVAKALADERAARTAAGVLKGKWAYLAPEQVEGSDIDQRADIFSLGIVLHEMLTGRRLFKAASGLATLERVRAAKVLAPSAHNPLVPAALDAICLRALTRLPADRFETAAHMAVALDAALSDLRFGAPELARQLTELFPAEAAAFAAAQRMTPAGQWQSPVYEDGDTTPSAPPADMARLTEPRARTGRVARLRRSRAWRVAMAATAALALGGLTGWQIARAQARGALPRVLRAAPRPQMPSSSPGHTKSGARSPAPSTPGPLGTRMAAHVTLQPVMVRTPQRG